MSVFARLNRHAVPALVALVIAGFGVGMIIHPEAMEVHGRKRLIANLLDWVWSRPAGCIITPVALLVAWHQIRAICTPEPVLRREDRSRLS